MDGEPRLSRRYLFLQGMPTQFFARLGVALVRRGHEVKRINFTAGDRLYWRLPGSTAYRGTLADWPAFFEACLNEWGSTDIILFGDTRPLHAAIIPIATLRGLTVHVFEEGYLRPNWITLEQGGVNNRSALPRDPELFRDEADRLGPWNPGKAVRNLFRVRATQDVIYYVWSWLFAWRYPGYRTHLAWHPFLEYAGWIRRFLRLPIQRRRTEMRLRDLAEGAKPYYLVPLQLDADSQIRVHSPFQRLAPAIREIVSSFARHAPPGTLLVLKEHPLDPQLADWGALARVAATRLGIGDRVIYLAGGPLDLLVQRSRGVVTVNSTAGLLALSFGTPVAALAQPIYNLPGLTFQHGLDRFWLEASPPEPELFNAFRAVVAHRTQINGGFFSAAGLRLAVAGTVERLEAAALEQTLTSFLPLSLVDSPVNASRGAALYSGVAD